MDDYVADGRIVGLALMLVFVEAVVLAGYFLRTGRGFAPATLVLTLAPGVCLMLALAAALETPGSARIALWLTAAGIAHAMDLWRSWPR